MKSKNGIHNGFTLLEVMVAVVILGLAMVVIMQCFSLGLKSSLVEKEYSIALLLARAKMGEVMVDITLEEGFDSGSFDNGYEWEVFIEPYDRPIQESAADATKINTSFDEVSKERFLLQSITLNIMWGGEFGGKRKRVSLNSLRLIRKEPDIRIVQ